MNKNLKKAIKIILLLAVYFVLYYFMLPPINLRSSDMWSYIFICTLIGFAVFAFSKIKEFVSGIGSGTHIVQDKNGNTKIERGGKVSFNKASKALLIFIGAYVLLRIIASVSGSPIFNARRYRDLIDYETDDFAEDVAELDMSAIPVVDRATATRLGLRKLGEMSDLVSQFEIDDGMYTQINYRGLPYRVTPLVYGDAIKWLNNHSDGIPAYIMVNMVSQETTLVRLDDKIMYSQSEFFFRNIERYLRFNYPTLIFGDVSFEVDDDGIPYWIAPVVQYRIGVWSGKDIGGAVLVNAINGDSTYYSMEEVPEWVDQVCVEELVVEQLNYHGMYNDGFWNAYFGQRGVIQTTAGYNYLAINDDVYLYTGMTSVSGDESNIGFVLVNLRTKETSFYAVPGAEEYSAMDSAEGQVQHLGYVSTFPILINVYDRPTYFMSLKDGAGLVKMYAFVDVQKYQIVGTGNTIREAREDYIQKLSGEAIGDDPGEEAKLTNVTGTLLLVSSAVKDGNTVYYFKLDGRDEVFTAGISISPELPFMKAGDTVTVSFMAVAGQNEIKISKIEMN